MIKLSDHFNYRRLLRFTLPSIIMMIVTSVYGVVDGVFVSNFAGKVPFAAINLIMPFLLICGSLGFMAGTGGSALVARTLGQGDPTKANRIFSLLVYVSIIAGIVLSAISVAYLEDIAIMLGAEGEMLTDCVTYGRIILPALSAYILQNVFQAFLITAERPSLGLAITIIAGVTNIVLDYIFIVPFDMGLKGAALATAISQCLGGIIPLLYFAFPNKSLLQLTRARFDGNAIVKTCTNGSSELIANISMSIVSMMYNYQLIRYIGADGVAAYGVIMYAAYIFIAVFLGFSIGSAPIVSYNYGAENYNELRNVFRRSLIILATIAIVLTIAAIALAGPLASIFVGYDQQLFLLTRKAFMIYSMSFILVWINLYTSAFFTALNNGLISAIVSFSRTLIFEVGAVLLIPYILGIDGIWISISVAESLAIVMSIIFLAANKKLYHYW